MTTGEVRNRLERLEALAETTLLAVQQLAIQQRNAQTQLTATVEDIVSMIGTLGNEMHVMQSEMREMQSEMREMQSEVRGLQSENRRILDVLLNERGNE